MDEDCIYSIALSLIPGIGPVSAKSLIESVGSACAVFERREVLPVLFPGLFHRIIQLLDCPGALDMARKEYDFIVRNHISCLTLTDPDYPSRLRECVDAPPVLFYKGNAHLNATKIISIVGTRKVTEYGKSACINFIRDIQSYFPDVVIVSGLAYGVDVQAHRSSLDYGLSTVGVLAHGLDRIYPYTHRRIAADMINNGGLLTEFVSGTIPERYNFISRNRIIAGLSDATLVIESAGKGGSLITADIAGSYNRECFAFPGRVTDTYSEGCNSLIALNKACLLRSAADFVELMGWKHTKRADRAVQKRLFDDLTDEQQLVVDLLSGGDMQINQLGVKTNLPVQQIHTIMFELEIKGLIRVLAGGMYQLL